MIASLEWKLAFRNLLRNKRRTFSTGIALVVAYMGITLLFGHVIKTERRLREMLIYLHHMGHVSVYKTGGIDHFEAHPDQYIVSPEEMKIVDEILQPERNRIEMVAGSLSTPALLSSGVRTIPVIIQGLEPELDRFVKSHPNVWRDFPELRQLEEEHPDAFANAVAKTPDAISVAYGVAELLGRHKPIDELTTSDREVVLASRAIEGNLNAVNATLSFKHLISIPYMEDISVITPLSLVRNLLQTEGVNHVTIFLKEMSDIKPVEQRLQAEFKKRGLGLEAIPFRDDRIGGFYNGTMSFLAVIVGFFFMLILGASTLILANSITMGVLERSKEMGTLRSLGFTPQKVRSLVVKEAILLALLSVAVGVVVAEVGIVVINAAGFTYTAAGLSRSAPIILEVNIWYHILMGVLMTGISVLCSYWIVTRKVKEKIPVLLLDPGGS